MPLIVSIPHSASISLDGSFSPLVWMRDVCLCICVRVYVWVMNHRKASPLRRNSGWLRCLEMCSEIIDMDGSTGELKMEEFPLLLLSFGELGLTLPIWGSTILYDCLRELIESSAVQVIKTMRDVLCMGNPERRQH